MTNTFPSTGTYLFGLYAADSEQIYINDQLVDQSVAPLTLAYANYIATAGQSARIRIDFSHQSAGTAEVSFFWTAPGGSSVYVPGTFFSPNYDLVTKTTSDDSAQGITGLTDGQVPGASVTTSYGSSPWLGQVASTTVDPTTTTPAHTGLNLTSSATYETATGTYERQLTSVKPAGAATKTTDAYYLATDVAGSNLGPTISPTPATNCVDPSTVQYGMLKTTTGPTPASGAATVTSYV